MSRCRRTEGESCDEEARRDRGEGQPVTFDLEDESAGTQTWFRLIGPAFAALRFGGVLLLDEIDASLHPRLSARLIEIFQAPRTNTRGAQLVFTSHDTSLLNSLNRDEVWLTEKASDTTTRLVGLAEFGGGGPPDPAALPQLARQRFAFQQQVQVRL